MENFRHVHVEEDVSSSDESDPKRHMSDNSDSTPKKISNLKNVVLLLDCDVRKENGEVYLPDGTEMARLKKPEREQFKKNIKFTRTMTKKDVEEELRRQFPILRNYGRLSCASAANRGTRLEFHYSPSTVWDGTKINKHIRGNSALYVLFERTPESVHERPESPPAVSSLQQLQTPTPKPMDSPLPCSSNLQRLKRKHDSSSSCVLEVVQNTGASVKKQVLEATSCPKGSKEGGQQSHQEQGDHSASPTTGLLCNSGLKQSSGEDHSKDSQEVSKVRRSVENNSSLDSAYESTSGDASGVDDNTEHSIGKTEEAASSHIKDLEDYLKDSQIDPTEGSSLDEISLHRVATGDQIFLSDREWNKIYQDTLGIPLFESVIQEIIPKEGPITGGTKFAIFVNVNGIPENLSSLRAIFEGVGFADLTPLNKSAYTGHSPASKILGKVAVTVGSSDGSWTSPDEKEFQYYPNLTQELQTLIGKMPHTKRDIPLDNQTLNPSRLVGTVRSPSSLWSVVDRPLMADESEDILSLKALQCILFAAAATNDRECIEIFFSTSAGEAVFQTYRNSSILPEDIARDRGHQNLAEYLQNVHKRFSKEIVCNVQTVTIDWVELKRATAKKDICSGTDESQGLESDSFLESDDDQSSYFADDETSICQSPSTSEFSNEDECIESKYAVTNVALHQNQEGADPAKDHFVTSTVMAVAGETSNAIELSSEGGSNSDAERQSQEPTDSMTMVLPCEINTETLMGPYIQTTTKNTFWKRCCDETDQKGDQDDLEKPLGYNQEGAGPAYDHDITSAVTTIAGETPNSSERGFEVGNNSSDSRYMQGPLAGITKELLCREDVERVAGPIIVMKTGNTRRERNCGGEDQEQELNNLDKPPVQDNLKQQLCEKHLTVAMATGRSPIKVPCENEDLPEKENAPDSQGATACVEMEKFEEAITCCDKGLTIDKKNRISSVREVGDKSMREKDHISSDDGSSGDVKKVKDFYNQGEVHGEGNNYGNLGNTYNSLGDFKKAIEYHNLDIKIAKEVGDKHGEGVAYGNLGNAYSCLGYFQKAIEYHNLYLKIAKKIGDKHGEGGAYGNLGKAYRCLGDFQKAIEYHNLHLKIAKEVGEKHGEGCAYGNLGSAYRRLVKLTKFAKAVVYTAFLRSGDVEQAEEIKSIHGEGYPVFLVTNEFMKAYAERGDVKKTLEYFERVKEISTIKDLPPFVYNQLVYCYRLHGDTDSQMKVLAEMEEKGVRKLPKTFSSVMFSFCQKGDVKSALEIFGQAKEEGPFVSQGSALRLLNTMAKTGQTEKFDSVLEDCLHHSVKAVEIPTEAREMIRGLVFACVHAGKTDLALKLMLENDVFLNANTLLKPARSAGWKGEVQALLNTIEFLKENVSPKEMYFHLIRAHDFHRDVDAIKAVYNEVVEEGMEMSAYFHEMYNHIMIKYSERLPSSEYNQTASATQTEIDVDDFSSDEEGADIQEFERETPDSVDSDKDIDEMNDPK